MANRNRRRTLAFQYGTQAGQAGTQNPAQAAALGGAQEASRFYETASELGGRQQGQSAYQTPSGASMYSQAGSAQTGMGQAARGGAGAAGKPTSFETAASPGTAGSSYQQAAQAGNTEAQRFYKTSQNLQKPGPSQ